MNTIENNKLIAEFIGMQYTDIGWYDNEESLKLMSNTFDDLEFHTSWDWLMPVVEKIESLGYWVNRHDGDIYIINNDGDIITPTPMSDGGKDMYYQAVVEFIKLYNENKK